ncbi:hypothetical protein ALC53_07561 [Atta colombica]|uniref:MADF domain-containing protein n=1 Tax=Atta colombica TaxID=520822 RepID=A0A195BBS4_9HYME|nr:hypothetical protein ALC53_07561 [Atta colombica]
MINHKMELLNVFIEYPNSVHDARVFKNSSLNNDLNEVQKVRLNTNYKECINTLHSLKNNFNVENKKRHS